MNVVKRNINIMTPFPYIINHFFSFIIDLGYFESRKYFYYFYVAFFIVALTSISYAQKSFIEKSGSIFVCIQRNDTIWIGVDSKIYQNPSIIECKILKFDNFVFAHVGLTRGTDMYRNFVWDIDSLFYRAITIKSNFYGIRNYINKSCKVWSSRIGLIEAAKNKMSIGESVIEASITSLFAIYEERKAKVFIYNFLPIVVKTKSGDSTVTTQVDSGLVIGTKNIKKSLGGVFQEIAHINPTDISTDIPIAIRELIKIEINAHPDKVGYPINIIRITKDGIRWIDKHQPCD